MASVLCCVGIGVGIIAAAAGCTRDPSASPANSQGGGTISTSIPTGSGEAVAKATGQGWLGVFPAYPGARKAGWQHIAGTTMHIECTVYAATDPPEQVAAFYAQRFPQATREAPNQIRVRGEGDAILSVHPVNGDYPRCDSKMEASDRTAIVVSKANR